MIMRRAERRLLIDAFVGWKPRFANRGEQGGRCRLCGCRNNGIMQKSRQQNKLWRKKSFRILQNREIRVTLHALIEKSAVALERWVSG